MSLSEINTIIQAGVCTFIGFGLLAYITGIVAFPTCYIGEPTKATGKLQAVFLTFAALSFVAIVVTTTALYACYKIDTTTYAKIESIETLANVDEKDGLILTYFITTTDGAEYIVDSDAVTFEESDKETSDLLTYARIVIYHLPNDDGSERLKVTIYE